MLIEDVIDQAVRTGDIGGAVDALLMEIRGYTSISSKGPGARGKIRLTQGLKPWHALTQVGDSLVHKLSDKQAAREGNPVYRKEWRKFKEKTGGAPQMFRRLSKPQFGIQGPGEGHPHYREPADRSLGL